MSSLQQLSVSHGLEEKANPASLEFVDCDKGFMAGELSLVFCNLGGVSSSFHTCDPRGTPQSFALSIK